ncbi:hypothetical protein [Nocardia sp. BMG51109]|uniref:hypothetical protein n=1 Tax=Nocardia sp. BMG51109 TaxID=1056816 RepID=UPI0012EBA03A|nr:hypothetical protein [Nocardia sp. BMG51109]
MAGESRGREIGPVDEAWVTVDACTLPTDQQPLRVAEFDALFGAALRHVDRVSPTRLRPDLDDGAEARARDLATRESGCCSFFTFGISSAGNISCSPRGTGRAGGAHNGVQAGNVTGRGPGN